MPAENALNKDQDALRMDVFCLKTMCLATSKVEMPTKDEHCMLLFNGLGARRWQIGMGCDSLSFKQAILNIYPRLRTVIGYNLWYINKSKQFERLPERANTPRRIKGFLGPNLPDCLMIVPIADITVMEENLEKLEKRNSETFGCNKTHPYNRKVRGECLVCGKTEKMYGSLQRILNVTQGSSVSISENICKLLGVDLNVLKKRDIENQEICRKCLRNVKDMMELESKLKKTKESFIGTFFQTISKFQGQHQGQELAAPLLEGLAPAPQDVPLDFSKQAADPPTSDPLAPPPGPFPHQMLVPNFPLPVKAEYPYFDPLSHLRGFSAFPRLYPDPLQELPAQLSGSELGGVGTAFQTTFAKDNSQQPEDLGLAHFPQDVFRWGHPDTFISHLGGGANEPDECNPRREKLDQSISREQESKPGGASTSTWILPEGERLNSHGSGSPCSGNESTSSSSPSLRGEDEEKEKRMPMKKRKRAQEN